MADVTVSASGPLFDGRAGPMVRRWTEQAGEEIARDAEDEVHRILHQVLRHPTGYFESKVRVDRVSSDSFLLSDGGVVYGPWLEGTGSRNSPATKFKGYRTFERVRQRVERNADRTLERHLNRHVREL